MTDEFDDALGELIGSRTGGPVDAGAARQAVVARSQRIRTVRTVAVGATGAAVLVGALVLLPFAGDRDETPADEPAAPTPTVTMTVPTPTTVDGHVESGAATETTSPFEGDADPASTTVRPTAPPTTASEPTVATTVAGASDATSTTAAARPSSPTTSIGTTPTPTTTPTTTQTPPTTSAPTSTDPPGDAPFTRQYDSAGGSITVDWNGSALTLAAVSPAVGHEAEIEDEASTRIRVRFRGDNDSRIEVRVRDGRVEHTIS